MTEQTPETFVQAYKDFIPEIWSQRLGELLYADAVMLQCVNKNYEGDIKSAGDTVNILTPGEISVSSLHGGNITYNEVAPSKKQLVIDQKKVFAFKINDVASAQAAADLMEAHLVNAKKAIEVDQDSYLLGLHTDADADNVMGSADAPAAVTTANVYSKFVEMSKVLKNANAFKEKSAWVVVNPDVEAVLLECPQFTSSFQTSEKTLREGAIGRIAGMDVLVSSNLRADSNGGVAVLAGTNDAITFASQVAKIEKIRDINTFSDLIRGLYLYGAKVVQPKALAVSHIKIS